MVVRLASRPARAARTATLFASSDLTGDDAEGTFGSRPHGRPGRSPKTPDGPGSGDGPQPFGIDASVDAGAGGIGVPQNLADPVQRHLGTDHGTRQRVPQCAPNGASPEQTLAR